jgi:hypothetical protein
VDGLKRVEPLLIEAELLHAGLGEKCKEYKNGKRKDKKKKDRK